MKYLLIILTFSLFILLPVKFRVILIKQNSDEYIKVEMDCFKVLKICLEIPSMKFIIKNFIPALSFEYHIDANHNSIPISEKIVILPFMDRYKNIIIIVKILCEQKDNLKRIIRLLSKYINVIDLSIYIAFGCENAALTGILAGQAWSIVYFGISILTFYLNFDNTNIDINVTPIFIKDEPLQIDINCIFRLRVGHIIIASSIVVWYWLLSKKKLSQKVA